MDRYGMVISSMGPEITKYEVGNWCKSKDVKDLLNGLRRGDCWCEMAVGNPNVKKHSKACLEAQEFMKEPEDD